MAAAAQVPMHRRVDEFFSCPICMEKLQNGKLLPCFHSCCLDCLKKLNDVIGGQKMPCPVCRKSFKIPPDGLDSLQSNFFAQKMFEIIGREGEFSELHF